jgi:hypothetical protein
MAGGGGDLLLLRAREMRDAADRVSCQTQPSCLPSVTGDRAEEGLGPVDKMRTSG